MREAAPRLVVGEGVQECRLRCRARRLDAKREPEDAHIERASYFVGHVDLNRRPGQRREVGDHRAVGLGVIRADAHVGLARDVVAVRVGVDWVAETPEDAVPLRRRATRDLES